MTKSSHPLDCYHGIEAVVLGGSGFIGRWVARALCARGAKVSLVVRDKAASGKLFPVYGIYGSIFELDLRAPGAVAKLFQKIMPSITFNLAGYGVDRSEREEEAAYQINAHLVKALCKAIVNRRDPEWMGQDIVHVGSVA